MKPWLAVAALGLVAQLALATPTPNPGQDLPPPPPGTGTYQDPYHPARCHNAQGQQVDCNQGMAAIRESLKLFFDLDKDKAPQMQWYDPVGVIGYTMAVSGGSFLKVHTPQDPNPVPYDEQNPFNHKPGDVVLLGLYFGGEDARQSWTPDGHNYFGWDTEEFVPGLPELTVFAVSGTLNSDYLPESLCLGCVSLPEVFKVGLMFNVDQVTQLTQQGTALPTATSAADNTLVMTWTPIVGDTGPNNVPEPSVLALALLGLASASTVATRRSRRLQLA